jgi:hypothetical protein
VTYEIERVTLGIFRVRQKVCILAIFKLFGNQTVTISSLPEK